MNALLTHVVLMVVGVRGSRRSRWDNFLSGVLQRDGKIPQDGGVGYRRELMVPCSSKNAHRGIIIKMVLICQCFFLMLEASACRVSSLPMSSQWFFLLAVLPGG